MLCLSAMYSPQHKTEIKPSPACKISNLKAGSKTRVSESQQLTEYNSKHMMTVTVTNAWWERDGIKKPPQNYLIAFTKSLLKERYEVFCYLDH